MAHQRSLKFSQICYVKKDTTGGLRFLQVAIYPNFLQYSFLSKFVFADETAYRTSLKLEFLTHKRITNNLRLYTENLVQLVGHFSKNFLATKFVIQTK